MDSIAVIGIVVLIFIAVLIAQTGRAGKGRSARSYDGRYARTGRSAGSNAAFFGGGGFTDGGGGGGFSDGGGGSCGGDGGGGGSC